MTIERFVQQCAARIVVVVVLTMEALFLEEEPIDRLHDALHVMRTLQTLLDRAAPCTELLQIVVEIEPRVVFERDHQRCFDEVEKRLWTCGKLHETLTRQSGMGQNTAGLHRSSLRLLQRFHLAAKLVTDRHLGLRVPIKKDNDDSSGGGNLTTVFTDLVQKIHGRGAHLTNANADLDRLHPELVTEITFCACDDESDVKRPASAGEVEPEEASAPTRSM